MSNKELILSILDDIVYSIELIQKRFQDIKSSDEFLANESGLEKLDSISMRLIAIGEGFKNIDKLSSKNLLKNYPFIDWQGVKGIRDILSHHYFQIDAEIIFNVCKNHLDELLKISLQIRKDLKDS